MRSGRIDSDDGRFWLASLSGYAWSLRVSSISADDTTASSGYNLGFNDTDVYTSIGRYGFRNGFPLRCLSTVLRHIE